MKKWIFTFFELILFGGLLIVYFVQRLNYPDAFKVAGVYVNSLIGGVNSFIMLAVLFVSAVSLVASKRGNRFVAKSLSLFAASFAALLLISLCVEWMSYADGGMFYGGEELLKKPQGVIAFFNVYYLTIFIFAAHVLWGMFLSSVAFVKIHVGSITKENSGVLECANSFWGFLTIIWLFIFPLFYLIR
ncbi:MAG: hypothetical protein GXO87_03635 [Chlorobi bacterium]|nr:hypothetical protein [Chlorobiota bacterium]